MRSIMLGNEAIARGAYKAGARVVSSYPGTPSTEITENTARFPEVHSEWAPNEKVALEVFEEALDRVFPEKFRASNRRTFDAGFSAFVA